MCGIVGVWDKGGAREDDLRTRVSEMAVALRHRGPDDQGVWLNSSVSLGFGFRRLAVLDLSERGHQPMISETRRFVVVFNGEIYNHSVLRRELKERGHIFRGHSDTEVILAAFEEWGISKAVRQFNGMFAISVWDSEDHTLTLVRDHVGIKPLYYLADSSIVLFGSELKALRAYPGWSTTMDTVAAQLMLTYGYVPGERTIYTSIRKVPPGGILTFSEGRHSAMPETYWSLPEIVARGSADPFGGASDDAVDQLTNLLSDAVRIQTVADVPVGVLLSGGTDSSLITALMRQNSSNRIRTFTVGFCEDGFDESVHAAGIAARLGTEHTQVLLSANDAKDVITSLPTIYDEPFADPAQIAVYLIAKIARQSVTVALAGEGGDELFAGYSHYESVQRIWRQCMHCPASLRHTTSRTLGMVAESLRFRRRFDHLRAALLARSNCLSFTSKEEYYSNLASFVSVPCGVSAAPPTPYRPNGASKESFLRQMMLLDTVVRLTGCFLTKTDRASAAVGLEVRVPLLDHRVIEFAWRLKDDLKLRGSEKKWILRQILAKHLPTRETDRPKHGLELPLAQWLRTDLRDWAEELLQPRRLRENPVLNVGAIASLWKNHLARRVDAERTLWPVLMLEAWQQTWRPSAE